MGYVPTHWDEFWRIPTQVSPQTDETATVEGNNWEVDVSPSGEVNAGGGVIIGG